MDTLSHYINYGAYDTIVASGRSQWIVSQSVSFYPPHGIFNFLFTLIELSILVILSTDMFNQKIIMLRIVPEKFCESRGSKLCVKHANCLIHMSLMFRISRFVLETHELTNSRIFQTFFVTQVLVCIAWYLTELFLVPHILPLFSLQTEFSNKLFAIGSRLYYFQGLLLWCWVLSNSWVHYTWTLSEILEKLFIILALIPVQIETYKNYSESRLPYEPHANIIHYVANYSDDEYSDDAESPAVSARNNVREQTVNYFEV